MFVKPSPRIAKTWLASPADRKSYEKNNVWPFAGDRWRPPQRMRLGSSRDGYDHDATSVHHHHHPHNPHRGGDSGAAGPRGRTARPGAGRGYMCGLMAFGRIRRTVGFGFLAIGKRALASAPSGCRVIGTKTRQATGPGPRAIGSERRVSVRWRFCPTLEQFHPLPSDGRGQG